MVELMVLYLYDKGFNISLLRPLLDELNADRVKISDISTVDPEDYDVLIYQTFPNESHPAKFEAGLVEAADEFFHEFKGIKVLFDAHDLGGADGFSRFADLYPFPPVIKLFANDDYPNIDQVVFVPDKDEPEVFVDWLTGLRKAEADETDGDEEPKPALTKRDKAKKSSYKSKRKKKK